MKIRKRISGIFLSIKVTVKKVTVLFVTRGWSNAGIRRKADLVADKVQGEVGILSAMEPTVAEVKQMVLDGEQLARDRVAAQSLVNSLVIKERKNTQLIKDSINDGWLKKIQRIANGNIDFITSLALDIKGMGTPPNKKRFGSTWPDVLSADQNTVMRLELGIIASDVLSRGKVYGAASIGCLRQIGGTVPPMRNDHPSMELTTSFSKMKFKDKFKAEDVGKIAYYIFFWVDTDGNRGPESPVFPYTITS